MFLLPGEATRDALVELLASRLKDICTAWTSKRAGIWKVLPSGLRPL
jgi:hypothetical protein